MTQAEQTVQSYLIQADNMNTLYHSNLIQADILSKSDPMVQNAKNPNIKTNFSIITV